MKILHIDLTEHRSKDLAIQAISEAQIEPERRKFLATSKAVAEKLVKADEGLNRIFWILEAEGYFIIHETLID